MVKMSNFCRQYRSAIEEKSNSRFIKVVVSPVIFSVLCLTATYDYAIARTSLDRIIPNTSLFPKKQKLEVRVAQSSTGVKQIPGSSPRPPAPPIKTGVRSYGNQISLNGRISSGGWLQQRTSKGQITTLVSDGALRQLIGVDLLDTSQPARQPIQWYSSNAKPQILSSLLTGGYRYLDISRFANTFGWQMQVQGKTLVLSTPSAKITNINQGKHEFGDRIVLNLDSPTPWQIAQGLPVKTNQPLSDDPNSPVVTPSSPTTREWTITLDGIATPDLIQRYTPSLPLPFSSPENQLKQQVPGIEQQPSQPPALPPLIKQVEVVKNQTIVRLEVPLGLAPLVSTLPNPNRLVIDIRPDALLQRSISWASGLRWQQQFMNLGQERFPVVWLDVNPRTVGLKLKPIVTNSDTLVGTAPLIQTAQKYVAVAAINGGYFNRNNKLPLGAIRRDNQWLSSPILNRGAIAWNDSGQFYMGRLVLQESLIGLNNLKLPILTLNSGYVQSGIARYTPTWGANYTPLTDNEIIIVVQKNQVTAQLPSLKAGQTAIPIPQDGYLLTLRGSSVSNASVLPIGFSVRIESSVSPTEFSRYPYILGAGPLLLQDRQIVLDAKGENFSNAFIAQKAVRSAICTTATGNLIIAAVHNRVGGAGPTLAEHAQLMQQMGCVNALNLDGGSSTSLYLGGQLLDRFPNTAARVHNGIGIFLQPRP
ncbi:phosphodiester glycosidase family protein [Chlorogloeopsis sp. ULAP01]|uniref:phosphodiester glycosidase family protein n=1 Tax=Chlorogloeopsis sp. ULAP01 TaxID=3056483 RepID=UPI0025AAC158|nr:phosphodiester glycosidase family protein [Chlorogloeopsis sp. ULAP01]MDM9380895.1 phosphodiester glycosidase family protein [Chlorogloeopsis sp. ULAP01]